MLICKFTFHQVFVQPVVILHLQFHAVFIGNTVMCILNTVVFVRREWHYEILLYFIYMDSVYKLICMLISLYNGGFL